METYMPTNAEVGSLLAAVDAIDRIGNTAWLETLDQRKRAELEFHRQRSVVQRECQRCWRHVREVLR